MKIKAFDAQGKLICILILHEYHGYRDQQTIDRWMNDIRRKHPCGSFVIC